MAQNTSAGTITPRKFWNRPFTGLLPKISSENKSFLSHLLEGNRLYQAGILLAVLLQFILFKWLYPYPDFFSDSWGYIKAARSHLSVNIWPIGYSWFLYGFHAITQSSWALIFFQFVFMQLAGWYFYKTLLYFYPTSKPTRIILSLFLFFNPLTLYLANYVSSDGLFAALSLLWLTELIWILQRPSWRHIFFLSLVFFIAFTFRYNALYYPLIASLIFLVSGRNIWYKVVGVVMGPVLVIPVIIMVSTATKQISGVAQFPPILGGWQWANNALYIREFVQEDTLHFPNPEMAELDRRARDFYRVFPVQAREVDSYVGNFYIRHWRAPLKKYMMSRYTDPGFMSWAKVAPLFNDYGKYIIKRHPGAFAYHFMLPNAWNYFLPPLEKLELYNLGRDDLNASVKAWFGFPDNEVKVISKHLQGYILAPLPYFFLLLNLYGLWSFFVFVQQGGFRLTTPRFRYTIGLMAVLLVLNFCFSVFANIVVMRYQIFPMMVCLVFVLLLMDYLALMAKAKSTDTVITEKQNQPVWTT